jgi:GT2 family glycosyltransferase
MASPPDKLVKSTKRSIFLSVCIITFRRPFLLAKCLRLIAPGIQTLNHQHYEVVVSDDSPEGSSRDVVEHTGFARWVQGPFQGVAANRNNVAKSARGHWIVFVDDDELPEPDWLEKIYQGAISEQWDVIEGRVEAVDYPDNFFWYAPSILSGGRFGTCNLAIRRELLFALGGFNEQLRVSHEDVELGGRIQAARLRTVFIADALVKHPARRMSLHQVWHRAIQQQCQTFLLHGSQVTSKRHHLSFVISLLKWSAIYLVRVSRFEFTFRVKRHWRRPLQMTLLIAFACPVASLQIFRTKDFSGPPLCQS